MEPPLVEFMVCRSWRSSGSTRTYDVAIPFFFATATLELEAERVRANEGGRERFDFRSAAQFGKEDDLDATGVRVGFAGRVGRKRFPDDFLGGRRGSLIRVSLTRAQERH